jgi:hypothetical protein
MQGKSLSWSTGIMKNNSCVLRIAWQLLVMIGKAT